MAVTERLKETGESKSSCHGRLKYDSEAWNGTGDIRMERREQE